MRRSYVEIDITRFRRGEYRAVSARGGNIRESGRNEFPQNKLGIRIRLYFFIWSNSVVF